MKNIKQKKAVIFDLDGTLFNTYQGIMNSYCFAAAKLGIKNPEKQVVDSAIGARLSDVFREKFFLSDSDSEKAVSFYRWYYMRKGVKQAKIYTGIRELLTYLKDKSYITGIATLKRTDFAKQIVENFSLSDMFNSIHGIDEKDKLKKTDIINQCLEKLDVKAEDAVYIGDSIYDSEGAKLSRVDFIGVTYGFGFKTKYQIEEQGAIYAADNCNEIIAFLDGWC